MTQLRYRSLPSTLAVVLTAAVPALAGQAPPAAGGPGALRIAHQRRSFHH